MPTQLSGAKILAIGIRQAPQEDLGSIDVSQLEAAIKDGIKRAIDAGITLVPAFIDTDNAQTFEDAKAKLRSAKWDAVSLGFGVRSNARFTPWFEEVVNIVMSEGRAPRILFPVHPEDLLPAAERVFALGGAGGGK